MEHRNEGTGTGKQLICINTIEFKWLSLCFNSIIHIILIRCYHAGNTSLHKHSIINELKYGIN